MCPLDSLNGVQPFGISLHKGSNSSQGSGTGSGSGSGSGSGLMVVHYSSRERQRPHAHEGGIDGDTLFGDHSRTGRLWDREEEEVSGEREGGGS